MLEDLRVCHEQCTALEAYADEKVRFPMSDIEAIWSEIQTVVTEKHAAMEKHIENALQAGTFLLCVSCETYRRLFMF